MSSPRPRIMRWSLAMAIISGLISLLALVGQAFGLVPFSARPNLAGMVLQTATALLVINMGVILYHIRLGRIPVLLKRGAGGELVRRLIFAAVLIPILISILMAFGYSAGLYDLTVAIALYTVLIVVTFVTLIYRISEAVSQAEEREVLKRALRARDEFLSIASHELKTPITSLKLQTQMTKRNLLSKPEQEVLAPERMKRFVDQADRSIDRLARLVDDMLDISRIATGKLALTPVDFDLVSLVQEAADRFSILFEAGQLSLSLPPNLVIHADRLRIEQVLTNLLTNASRYGEGKAVELRLTQLDGSVVLEIQDHGRGIAIGDQDRIFQRFERAISPNEVSGMGLGLFIVREILNLHGGDIRVTSELGRGSTFIVTFPARPAAIPA